MDNIQYNALSLMAYRFALIAHGDQKRRYTGEPYIEHPVAVYSILKSANIKDRDVLAAALLHDTVEDTYVEFHDLARFFNSRIVDLVREVTDVSIGSKENRAVRKQMDLEHLAKASPEGQTIKLADLIHNTCSIMEHDKGFAALYMTEKRALLKVLTKGDIILQRQANNIVNTYFEGVEQKT